MRPLGIHLFMVLIFLIFFSGKFWHHSNEKNPGQQGKKFCIGGKNTPMLPYFEEKRSD